MNFFISYQLGEVEVSNLTIVICAIFSSFTFIAVGISSYKLYKSLINNDDSEFLIGTAGFEPTTPTTPKWCATKLRYAPY